MTTNLSVALALIAITVGSGSVIPVGSGFSRTLTAQSSPPQSKKYPIFTTDHLNQAMKTVGLAYGLTATAVGKNDFPNAKDYLVRARDSLATTVTFWRDLKKDDAVGILRETLKKIDALDDAMSAASVDAAAVKTLAASVGTSCEACHAKYRERDPATKEYRVRADAIR